VRTVNIIIANFKQFCHTCPDKLRGCIWVCPSLINNNNNNSNNNDDIYNAVIVALCSLVLSVPPHMFIFSVENLGSKAAKKNKKRNSKKKSVSRDEVTERETVDFNYMLTELKKQLEEAKSSKVACV